MHTSVLSQKIATYFQTIADMVQKTKMQFIVVTHLIPNNVE